MSGTADLLALPSKRSTSPRPPAVGEEVKKFHESSQPYHQDTLKTGNMEYQPKVSGGEYMARSITPTCTVNNAIEVADCLENSPNPSPPPPYKWAQSLLCLLEDIQGVALFQQFLKQEGQDTRCLSFWFACRGLKIHNPNDREGLLKLINVVFEKKVRRISAISTETKEEIKHKLSTNSNVNDTIFDVAQREVEAYMMKTTYPNFLRSDLYIQHLSNFQSETVADKESRLSPEPLDYLPTVHEDSELQICNKIPLTKSNLLQRNKFTVVTKLKSEGPAGYLRSPYSNYSSYHTKYGSYLPASAQDSELQSLSSDAQTDDTMSQCTDSSVDFPLYSRSKQKRQQKLAKHNAPLNKDKLSTGAFIPRTERLPETMQPKNPEEFHLILVKKLNKVLEEQRMKDKISEKLRTLENAESSKPDIAPRPVIKPAGPQVFDNFLCGPSEENVQDILDQHISRVFNDSGQHTPAMSSGCLSPPVAKPSADLENQRIPPRGISCEPPPDVCVDVPQQKQFTVPNSIRPKRDPDTHSTDSAMFDYVSDDNMPSSYRSQYSSANSELVDYSRRSREHSKRYVSKKLSSMTDSSSSCVDSGISLACESVPSYSKVTYWLETKRISEQEREQHMWRNSSTSPVLSRSSSSRKAVVYNRSSQEVGCSQWAAIATQIVSQDPSMPPAFPPPDTTSNLLEARRRLEDESRAKQKLKSASGARNSYDVTRMKVSKGHDVFDEGVCHRKLSRKSFPSTFNSTPIPASNDVTVIGYSYGRHSVPYLSKLPGKNITLHQFKSLLSKKGNFRYFFKTASNDFGTGVVFEEVTDDFKVLPMWEGKVFCVIESMDDNS